MPIPEPTTPFEHAFKAAGGDLSKLVIHTPYVEFPRMLHKSGDVCLVHDATEKAAKLDEGWSLTPGGDPVHKATKAK